jgi:hypothetical protein
VAAPYGEPVSAGSHRCILVSVACMGTVASASTSSSTAPSTRAVLFFYFCYKYETCAHELTTGQDICL